MERTSSKKLQRGQGMTEYIIVVALIAIGAIATFTYFGHTVQDQVAAVAHGLSGDGALAVQDHGNATAQAGNATTESQAKYGLKDFGKDSTVR
jgi:Flp pilus assembly pilin Flp